MAEAFETRALPCQSLPGRRVRFREDCSALRSWEGSRGRALKRLQWTSRGKNLQPADTLQHTAVGQCEDACAFFQRRRAGCVVQRRVALEALVMATSGATEVLHLAGTFWVASRESAQSA